jgi:TRAP-type C4-dicarboxylate transport system permease small subunit
MSTLSKLSFALGAAGLLGAMALDFTAVVGRHIGVPLLGSLELSEASIVCMASASLLGTTLDRGHASVHLLIERLSVRAKQHMLRGADALSGLFFLFVLCGSVLLVAELWNGAEYSELLHVPIVPLRLIWCCAAAAIVGCFGLRALGRRSAS